MKDYLIETFFPKSNGGKDLICIMMYGTAIITCAEGSELALKIAYIALIAVAIFLCIKYKNNRVIYAYTFAAIIRVISLTDGFYYPSILLGLFSILILNLIHRKR